MTSDVVLNNTQKNIVTSIQKAQRTIDSIQEALATGRDVNSAIDDPLNFFAAQALKFAGNDLNQVLDNIGTGLGTLDYADNLNTAQLKLIDQAGAILQELETLNAGNGKISISVNGQTQNVYRETIDGETWILIGRGREGWEFDTDGQGDPNDVTENLGTVDAFEPAAYSDDFVNGIIEQAGQNFRQTDIRIKRAANIEGTEYQEVRWTNPNRDEWTLNIEDSPFVVDHEVFDSVLGPAIVDNFADTRNTGTAGENDYRRVWTFRWPGKGFVQGFSYGSAVAGVNNDPATSFLWENTGENHATPYAEIYIRADSLVDQRAQVLKQDYLTLLDQMNELAGDEGYRGVNLMNNDDYEIAFNAERTSILQLKGIDATRFGLGLERENLDTLSDIQTAKRQIYEARLTLRSYGNTLSQHFNIVKTRQDFTREIMNTYLSGSDDLTVADQNENGAKMLAAQTRQSLQTTALSLANESARSVLRLFG